MVKVLKLVNKHVIVKGTKSIWRVGTLSTVQYVRTSHMHMLCVHTYIMYVQHVHDVLC